MAYKINFRPLEARIDGVWACWNVDGKAGHLANQLREEIAEASVDLAADDQADIRLRVESITESDHVRQTPVRPRPSAAVLPRSREGPPPHAAGRCAAPRHWA